MKLLITFHFFISTAWALTPDYCNLKSNAPVKIIKPKNPPDYFFKSSSDGKYIYYISQKKNFRINTKTGLEEQLPGIADPVPSPDGKILTYLDTNMLLKIVPLKKNHSTDASQTFIDETRTYQSVGMKGNTYRIFSQAEDKGEVIFNQTIWKYTDYSLDEKGIKPASNPKIVPDSGHYRLGLINKTGDLFTAFNYDSMKTEIVSIETGKVEDTLPVGSGKADFSYDDNKITFHITSNIERHELDQELSLSPIQHDGKKNKASRNIFVYDRNSKKLKRITNFKEGNAFFPVFLENGQIMYLYKDKGSNSFEFHLINEPAESQRSVADITSCLGQDTTNKILNTLSEKWLSICKNVSENKNIEIAQQAVLGLPKEYCLLLGENEKEINNFCNPKAGSAKQVVKTPPANKVQKAAETLENKCMICHTGSLAYDKIKERIESDDPNLRMPKGGELTAEEKDEILYLLKMMGIK